MNRLMPDLDATEYLILIMFFILMIMMVVVARHDAGVEELCSERGGIYVDDQCIDISAVIPMDE